MQTSAQKTEAIRFGSVKMFLDGVNVGLLDNAVAEVSRLVAQLKAHNGKLPPKKKPESIKFTAELYEMYLDNIAKIDSHGVLTNVAGTEVNVTGEAPDATFTANVPFMLANANGNGTAVTNIVITVDGSANTNFETFVQNGYTYILPTVTASGAILVDYDYTPNASKQLVISDVLKLVTFYEVQFINTDENGKELKLIIPQAYNTSALTFSFASDDAIDEVMKTPIEMEAFPDDNGVMLRIIDEQSVA